MKTVTIIVVALLVGGGGTAVAVATVGNVDWDQWHLFGNHNEDLKRNCIGVNFSVIHTDPGYNEEDGMYYAVSKIQAYYVEGSMVLYNPTNDQIVQYVDTPEGILVTVNKGHPDPEVTCLFPDKHPQTMTIVTHESINDQSYRSELCQKYNLPDNTSFSVKYQKVKGGPSTLKLNVYENGEYREIDGDFHFKMVEKTVTAVLLSENEIYELQHIDPDVDSSLKSIYDMEEVLNKAMSADIIRIVEVKAVA